MGTAVYESRGLQFEVVHEEWTSRTGTIEPRGGVATASPSVGPQLAQTCVKAS